MRFSQLRHFAKIVEAGSFSRAATMVHIAQPALSKQIAELEGEFGMALLHRSARGVTPTVAGKALYTEVLKLIHHADSLAAIARSAQGYAQGMVTLGVASTLAPALIGKMLELCRDTLPGVTLRFCSGGSQTLREKVAAHAVDLAIVFEDQPEPGFQRQELFRQRLYLASPEGSAPLASISLQEISVLPLVLPTPANVLRRYLSRMLAEQDIAVTPIAESDLLEVLLAAVENDLGHAVMPKGDFSDVLGHQGIATTPIEPPVQLSVCLIKALGSAQTQAMLAVETLLLDLIDAQLEGAAFKGATQVPQKRT